MSFFTRYSSYLQNNPEEYWFKNKAYGWGWVPATWQGWTLLVIFILVLIRFFIPFVNDPDPTNQEVIYFIIKVAAWAGALVVACYATGEPPKWQWGLDSANKQKS